MQQPGDLGKHAEAGGGLAAGALEFVVENGVLETGEIERGGVAHQANADVVREAVAEKAFGEAGGAHQQVAGDGEGKFNGDQGPKAVRNAGFRACGDHYKVDNEFCDPQHPQGHQGPYQAADQGDDGQKRAGFPNHAEQRRQISKRLEAVMPGCGRIRFGNVGIHGITPGTEPPGLETTTAGNCPPVDVWENQASGLRCRRFLVCDCDDMASWRFRQEQSWSLANSCNLLTMLSLSDFVGRAAFS